MNKCRQADDSRDLHAACVRTNQFCHQLDNEYGTATTDGALVSLVVTRAIRQGEVLVAINQIDRARAALVAAITASHQAAGLRQLQLVN